MKFYQEPEVSINSLAESAFVGESNFTVLYLNIKESSITDSKYSFSSSTTLSAKGEIFLNSNPSRNLKHVSATCWFVNTGCHDVILSL